MMADSARNVKEKKAIVMVADVESVNTVSPSSLILSVKGIAVDADDIKRYAIT
jgi:hypothetical protein